MTAAVLVCGAVMTGCRQDMHNQPKFIPLRANDFYADQRSNRDPVPGTVARGQLKEDSYFYTGKHGVILGNELPAGITFNRDLVLRGQQRFGIYCTPCHSELGDGNGMIVQRGYKKPPSFHDERLIDAPLGHFFDVASNGFGAMPDYAAQIKPYDRWAIAVYIRALQRSQHAKESDLVAAEAVAPAAETKEKPETMSHQQPAREGGKQ